MTVVSLHSRFERLERAWRDARAAADPEVLIFPAWLPAVRAAVPDASLEEITAMLRWAERKYMRESEELMARIRVLP